MYLSQLFIHPIKSAAAVEVDSLNFNARGPEFDRQWMVVDLDGKSITQRTHPLMCRIHATVVEDELILQSDDHSRHVVAATTQLNHSSMLTVTIWGDQVTAYDCGDGAAKWLSDFLQTSCRLVTLANQHPRQVDLDYARRGQTVGFADGFPTLIASQASLDEFNSHLSTPIDMRRFRPNIVVAGCLPYAEDTWRKIRINDIEFELVKPCSRCIIPSINPDTGNKEMEINDVLIQTRRRNRETFFGQNALHSGTGIIKVGDRVELND